jgi:hypothetical protein
VEFAVFAAGIHTGWKFAEQHSVERPATLLTAIIGSAEHFRSDLLWYCALSFWVSASEDHGQFHLGRLFDVIAPVTPVPMTRAYVSNEFSRLPASWGAEQWCLHGDCWAVAVSAGSNDVVGSVIHLDILPCVRSEAIETVSHRQSHVPAPDRD